jgi:class 3 adenylate cyclase
VDAPAAATAATYGFIGRTSERTLLRHLIREAAEGRPAVVVVSGVPGAGKTALLEWTAAAATGLGAEVLRASGYESSLPFAALRRLVAPFPELAELVRTSDTSTFETSPSDATLGGSTMSDLPRLLVEAFVARARRRILAVLLDDAQDLGDASRTVLDDALAGVDDAGARQPLQLFVMLTARAPIDPGGLADRAMRLRAARTVALGGFDDQEVVEFVTAAGRRPRRSVVMELLESTGGLPLLIESEVQRWRTPSEARGAGELRHPADDARVRSISDALRLRFDQVDEATRQTLQRAAVLGEPWNPEELAVVAEHSEAEIEAMTDAAEKARLISRSAQGVRFAHPLVRSDLLDRLSAERRSTLHRSTAERLRAHYDSGGTIDDEAVVRIADHLLRGGPDIPRREVAETALRAGRIAMGWTAYDQASRFFAASANAAVGLHPADELARRFLEAARAAYFDYDNELAESLFARAITFARQAGDDAVRLTAAMLLTRMRGGQRLRPWDRIDTSELREALQDDPEVDVGVRVQAEGALAEGLISSGDGETALPILASARRAATAVALDPSIEDALGRLDFTAGIQPMTMLDLDAADSLFASALTHALEGGNALTGNLARSRRALLGLMRGTIRRSHAELVEVEQRTVTAGFWGEAGLAAALMAFAEVIAGRPEAADRVEQAHRQWRRTGNPWTGAILSAIVPALAARAAAPGRRARDPSSLWESRTDVPTPSTFAALVAVEAHDVRAARHVLETARWRRGFRGPLTLNNTAVPTALIEVGDMIGDSPMVRAGLAAMEHMYERGVLVTLPWPACVPRLLAVGARHLGEPDQARRYVDAALDLANREGLAPERAKCLLESARIAGAGAGAARGEAEAAMAEAVQAFDEQSMHGWVARCDDIGRQMKLPPAVGSSGLVRERTILTNDVVGSTVSNVRLGDVLYLEQLRVHDRLLRARLKEFRGVEIKHTGDGLNAVFDDRADAIRCALAAMGDFHSWNVDEPELALQIRCGLAHGSLVPSGGDFFGLVQSEAARVCSLAGAGEVLATARVVEDCPPGVAVTSLGQHTLRGLPTEVEVFRLTAV